MKRVFCFLLALCFSLVLMPENAVAATTNKCPIEAGTYTLTPRCASNMCLDVSGSSLDDQANVQIWEANSTGAQQFQLDIVNVDNGDYVISADCSSKVLDVQWGSTSSGTNVWQYGYNGTDAQIWRFESAGDGYYYIVPKLNTNLCLDVSGSGNTSGTNVQVWTKNRTDAQKWKLTRIDTNPVTFTVNNTSAPSGNLGKIRGYGLKGVIKSNYYITGIFAQITDKNGNVVSGFDYTKYMCDYSYNIQSGGLNDAFIFRNLKAGSYSYEVFARASGVYKSVIHTNFTIG